MNTHHIVDIFGDYIKDDKNNDCRNQQHNEKTEEREKTFYFLWFFGGRIVTLKPVITILIVFIYLGAKVGKFGKRLWTKTN